MQQYIKRLPANTEGRDFVCGDIHGSYSCVQRFLKEIDFQPQDRLICSGDLVDRGPQNEQCLELLLQPWFYSVQGNHEQLMQDYFKGTRYAQYWVPNGGGWGVRHALELTEESLDLRDIIENTVSALPLLLTVEQAGGGVFHVLHAELFSRSHITDEMLADESQFLRLATMQTQDGGDVVTWGRRIFNSIYRKMLDETAIRKFKTGAEINKLNSIFNPLLSHIYSGHTIVQRPVQFYGQTNLDTCAYGSYASDASGWEGLTVTEPATGRFWLSNDREFKEVTPIIIGE